MKKKLHIKTWGCQMNVYDSARMADIVAPLGYITSEDVSDADLVIFNTCHIREKASEKLFSELGRLKSLQQAKAERGERMMVAVAGCVAQAEGAEIQRRAPFVDMVFGPQTYHQLPEMIARVNRNAGLVLNTEFPNEDKFDFLPNDTLTNDVSSFVSIQEGCDKFCTFCVVPYTRGPEYSRPVAAILEEAKKHLDKGAREIVLLGQNVNAYHGLGIDGNISSLGKLLLALAELPGLKRLRYTTSHPLDIGEDLLEAHRDIPAVMPFLHLPVQSGSDTILKAMNRKHSVDDYRRAIDKFRLVQPGITFSSDFIVGFPGETDEDFSATLKLIRDINYSQAYSFKYSRRPGTPASAMTNQVAEDVKDIRLETLMSLLWQQQKAYNLNCVGETVPILFDRPGKREKQIHGRTPYMQSVHCEGTPSMIGQIIDVKITSATQNSLTGTPVIKSCPQSQVEAA